MYTVLLVILHRASGSINVMFILQLKIYCFFTVSILFMHIEPRATVALYLGQI